MNGFSHHFGLAVRQSREALGWSQEQLAARADLNRSYVGEVERGRFLTGFWGFSASDGVRHPSSHQCPAG